MTGLRAILNRALHKLQAAGTEAACLCFVRSLLAGHTLEKRSSNFCGTKRPSESYTCVSLPCLRCSTTAVSACLEAQVSLLRPAHLVLCMFFMFIAKYGEGIQLSCDQ